MATTKKRVVFYADDAMDAQLKAESARTGAPVGEIIRRAIQKTNAPAPVERRVSQQPVLFVRPEDTDADAS